MVMFILARLTKMIIIMGRATIFTKEMALMKEISLTAKNMGLELEYREMAPDIKDNSIKI